MDEGRQKDLQLLEEIIDKCLKQKLLQTIAYTVLVSLFSFYAIHCGLCCICCFSLVLAPLKMTDSVFHLKVTVHSHLVESHSAVLVSSNLVGNSFFSVTATPTSALNCGKTLKLLRKMVFNLGSEVYMQAGVVFSLRPDTRHIFMDVGLGFYVEFTRKLNGVIAQIKKGRIKLLSSCNSLVSELNSMSNLSEKCNIQIPVEVLSLIDDGKNPDEFTRDVLNSCISRNQVTKGKTDAFKELGKHILEELEETFPDEVDKYREIRATSAAAEAKRLQSVLTNGDAKVKSEL
ncbi:hypothetical protein YC2023_058936 [Brassica napus]